MDIGDGGHHNPELFPRQNQNQFDRNDEYNYPPIKLVKDMVDTIRHFDEYRQQFLEQVGTEKEDYEWLGVFSRLDQRYPGDKHTRSAARV